MSLVWKMVIWLMMPTRPIGLLFAAFAVHLWLPLLGMAAVFLRSINFFRLAVGTTQNFIAKGASHPLEAIGYVAGTFVVIAVAIAKLALQLPV